MGARAQVLIKDDGVYLYTHWGSGSIEGQVRTALAKRWRWDDSEYLARIIFDVMTEGERGEETGFGIGTAEHGDIETLVTVDCKKKEVTVRDCYTKKERSVDFTDFILEEL